MIAFLLSEKVEKLLYRVDGHITHVVRLACCYYYIGNNFINETSIGKEFYMVGAG